MSDFDKLLLITAALLVNWRLAYMFTSEAGAFGIFTRLRWYVGANPAACSEQSAARNITNVFCCLKCMSVWTPLIIGGLVVTPEFHVILYGLALSAGAIMINRIVS